VEIASAVIGNILALLIAGAAMLVLVAIVRFSIISGVKSRGAQTRLRSPQPEGVAEVCGFPPPPELVSLFREANFVTQTEFILLDTSQAPPRRWEIGSFIPLTRRDVREARLVHGIRDGIPVATDLDKGSYVLLPDGRIVLRELATEAVVAKSAGDLRAFAATPLV
jgi:hypothetical protein